VVKQASPEGGTTFAFTGDLGPFDLAVPAQPSRTFDNLAPGTYTVTEAIPAGWVLSGLTCDDGSSTNLTTATATVELAAGENVTCTFSNEGITPDVKMTINDNQDPVPAGKEFWYYVNLANLGAGTASGVMVELLFIDGRAQLMNAPSTAFGCDATVRPSGPNLVLLEINDLTRACRISVPVVAGAAGLYKTEARVIQGGGDPSNDHDVEFTRVLAPLQLTQTVEPGPVVPVGTQATFVIRVTNVTAAGITNVRLFDQLPPGLTYVSDDGGGSYVAPNWYVGTLAEGTSATLRIVASVDAPGEFTNTVAVAAADGVSEFPPPVSVVVDAVAAVSVLAATTAVAGADTLPATGLTLESWLLLGLALIGSGTAMVVRVNRSRVQGRYG
jgi:uncharacterized repeat protein (TIGR01451 family)